MLLHRFKLRLIDRWIEIRIDCGLRNAKMIGASKHGLGNFGLHLLFGHAELKTQQLRRRRQFSRFLRALRGRALGQEEDKEQHTLPIAK